MFLSTLEFDISEMALDISKDFLESDHEEFYPNFLEIETLAADEYEFEDFD